MRKRRVASEPGPPPPTGRKPGSAALLLFGTWQICVAAWLGRQAAGGVRWFRGSDAEFERVCLPIMRQGELGKRELHFDLPNLAWRELRFRQTISEGLNFTFEVNDV